MLPVVVNPSAGEDAAVPEATQEAEAAVAVPEVAAPAVAVPKAIARVKEITNAGTQSGMAIVIDATVRLTSVPAHAIPTPPPMAMVGARVEPTKSKGGSRRVFRTYHSTGRASDQARRKPTNTQP